MVISTYLHDATYIITIARVVGYGKDKSLLLNLFDEFVFAKHFKTAPKTVDDNDRGGLA